MADETGATVLSPGAILEADVDVLSPCAVGGVIDEATVDRLRAWAVCGAANNVLADDDAARRLRARDVLFVPDVVASAGAVVHGIGETVMGLADRTPLIDRLGDTARTILERARAESRPEAEVAVGLARKRIATRPE